MDTGTMTTPEAVAYQLMRDVMKAENRVIRTQEASIEELEGSKRIAVDRAYLLNLYSECLDATRGHRSKE
jgi:hypothetical protein